MTRLDDALFQTAGWFVIDAQNQRVPDVIVTSAEQGLELVGRGRVASVVGRLVDGVRAVDVDLVGERGHAVTEAVAAWCRARGLWHLVRPSGGAEGRAHVLVAVGGHEEGLEGLLEQLRVQWRASRTTIDLRSTLRPLSAPHRTGGWTAPLGNLTASLAALGRAVAQQVQASQAPHSLPSRSDTRHSPAVGILPRRRRRRSDLPARWEEYLSRGTVPVIAADQPCSRSNHEALATAHLLWAGHDPDTAWSRITTAHPSAFTKARTKGRTWWVRNVWDPAVRADDDHTGPVMSDEATAAAIGHARANLVAAARSVPERARPNFLTVGHTVLDRMERTGRRRIPVPERDLVLDTALTDRRTIREHLARLEHTGVVHIHRDTLDPTQRDTTSYEAEAPALEPEQVGVREQIPPPSLHTPLPGRLPDGCPLHAWLVLRALSDTPASPGDLARDAQLTLSSELTPGQQRTLRTALAQLSSIGLAQCDENGQWRRGPGLTREATQRADERQQRLRAVIDAERAAYRAPGPSRWQTERALAHKRQRAKEVAWWRGLSPTERAARRARWASRFAASSVQEQHQVKNDLVSRQRRLGVDPVARHQRWVATNATEQRRLERAEAYATLPQPLQIALARAWQDHRARHDIPRDLSDTRRVERELETVSAARGTEELVPDLVSVTEVQPAHVRSSRSSAR